MTKGYPVRGRHLAVARIVFAALAGTSLPAAAQTTSFGEYVSQATEAYQAGDYDDALRLLRQAYLVQRTPQLLFNMAKSYEKKGDCKMANAYYRAYQRDPEAEEQIRGYAARGIEELGSCPAYDPNALSGLIIVHSIPSGAAVTVAGQALGTTPLMTAALPVGVQKVVATSEEHDPLEQEVTFKSETDVDLRLKLTKEATVMRGSDGAGVSLPDPGLTEISTPSDGDGLSPWPVVVMGAGGATLIGAMYLDFVTLPANKDERAALGPGERERWDELKAEFDSTATTTVVLYMAGGVLLAGGATWLVLDLLSDDEEDRRKAKERRPRLGLQMGLGGMGVFGTW